MDDREASDHLAELQTMFAEARRLAPGRAYAVADAGTPVLSGAGGLPGAIARISLVTDDICVQTHFDLEVWSTPEEEARRQLAGAVVGLAAMWPWLPFARRRAASVDAVPAREVVIAVDGEPRGFVLVEARGRWAAADEGIVVSGRGPVPAALTSHFDDVEQNDWPQSGSAS